MLDDAIFDVKSDILKEKSNNFLKRWLEPILYSKNISIDQLAERLEISVISIELYLDGIVTPNERMLNRICRELDLPANSWREYCTPSPINAAEPTRKVKIPLKYKLHKVGGRPKMSDYNSYLYD